MRVSTPALVLALAVFATAMAARGEGMDGGIGRCLDRPMAVEYVALASRSIPAEGKTPAKRLPAALASQEVRRAPGPGGQSHAPVMCEDPDQPGCQVSAPERPSYRGFELAHGVAARASVFGGLEAPSVVLLSWTRGPEGTPGEAHERLPWRPPLA